MLLEMNGLNVARDLITILPCIKKAYVCFCPIETLAFAVEVLLCRYFLETQWHTTSNSFSEVVKLLVREKQLRSS